MSVKYPRFLKKSEKKNENTKLSAQITDQSLWCSCVQRKFSTNP